MSCGCKATINESDERAETWRYVYGELSMPISLKGGLYHAYDTFPDKRFLQGDVAALDTEQRTRLIERMALKFGIPPEEVADNLSSGVFPILDEHVTIAFCRTHSIMLGV